MGFGSYDESEQEKQQTENDVDEDDVVNLHGNDHEGEVSYESNASSEELLDKLQEMKGDAEEGDGDSA